MTLYYDVDALLQAVRGGDEAAISEMFTLYFQRLVVFAQSRLSTKYGKMRDGEDAALSTLNSFVGRARRGEFPKLTGERELWKLLLTMNLRKVSKYVQHETRQRRDQGRTVSYFGLETGTTDRDPPEHAKDARIDKDMQIIDLDADSTINELAHAMQALDTDQQRQIAQSVLNGHSFEFIAQTLDVHPSTVYRNYHRILDIWKQRSEE